MKCIICEGVSEFYFSKTYVEPPFDAYMKDIGPIVYFRCRVCGFCLSKTHSELPESKWIELNTKFHHYLERDRHSKINQPPYSEQALMAALLFKNGLVNSESVLDYAAGYGTLRGLLKKYFAIEISAYDPYVNIENSDGLVIAPPLSNSFGTVINSAMFEHVLCRNDLEAVNALVAEEGSLIIHTVVCENIPCDPEWFYLRPPVHTAFHTNRSMEILMRQWGYRASIYCPQAKCWTLFKRPYEDIQNAVKAVNDELQATWFYGKNGFLDYWKGF